MTAKVTRAMSDSSGDPEWEITVTRADSTTFRRSPVAADLPADIRAGLLEWLGGSLAAGSPVRSLLIDVFNDLDTAALVLDGTNATLATDLRVTRARVGQVLQVVS